MKSILLSFVLCFCFIGCLKKRENGPFRYTGNIAVDGLTRTYTLNLPPNYYEADGFSLVIAMHGGGGNGNQFENSCKLTEKANAAKFIVVYPDGVRSNPLLKLQTWNAGGCCGYAADHQINDVKFISELIDKLTSTYKINPKKVYATGHSNGGMMAYRLACELSGKIAAIAPNSSTMVITQPCNASRAVPVLHMHSILDTNVPYMGGVGTGLSNHYNPPLDSVFQVWSLKNACATPAQVITNNNSYKLTKWTDCSNNVSIQYYLTKDGGHAWPGGLPGGGIDQVIPSAAINANDLLWDFFQQYQLP